MQTINIGQDFSKDPSGRYISDGPGSGEEFRENYLRPILERLTEDEQLMIVLDDGVEGYGSSFLVESFAGLVKYGYIETEILLKKLRFNYTDPDFEFYKDRILSYIKQAEYNSQDYTKNE